MPYLPVLVILIAVHPAGSSGLAWLAVCFFGVYMLARLVTLGWRVRRAEWLTVAV